MHRHHFDHWMRHMASVPKGFLKFKVLKLLNEKPFSGSEIMNEIEKETDEQWKPSPGSIYPLLAWLQDKNYTEIALNQEPGMKRYTLTDEGKEFLQEHIKRRSEIRKRFGGFRPHFMSHWFNSYPKNTNGLLEEGKNFMKASWKLLDKLREKYTEEAAMQAKEVIKQASEKLNEIADSIEQEN
ncbi:MAG: PadR family transcriptional regulator [Candidatus Bathyarchaeota archaeon]|jgi:DNA-binding PadR family transcriptional regulator